MRSAPEAVLFDMDGTLFDSEVLWDAAINELAASFGAVVPVEIRLAMVGTSMHDSVQLLHDGIGQPWRDGPASAEWINERVGQLFETSLVWRPGARELLHAVRAAGVPTALVTATPRKLVELAVETAGRQNFDVLVCGDEVTHTKPHPEPYATAARLLGVDITRCVAIEDSPTGVASAVAAGATVLAVPNHVPLEAGPRVTLRESLAGVGLADLTALTG
ncbi:MAG TPA: HAD family phosphatase [Candidatus Limnocylindrales bacterium]|nr:HAD family phosphatase [Candidatus Limnocylindrales bacterium]